MAESNRAPRKGESRPRKGSPPWHDVDESADGLTEHTISKTVQGLVVSIDKGMNSFEKYGVLIALQR